MDTLSNHFTHAAVQYTGISTFSLLLLAIAIIDDKERAAKRQQKNVTGSSIRGAIHSPDSSPFRASKLSGTDNS